MGDSTGEAAPDAEAGRGPSAASQFDARPTLPSAVDHIRTPVQSALQRTFRAFGAPVPWNKSTPYNRFTVSCLAVVLAILLVKVGAAAPLRLQVYVIEVAVIFVLGFAVLEGQRARTLSSLTTRGDLMLVAAGFVGLVLWNAGAWASNGHRSSPDPGFADAIAAIMLLYVAAYGVRRIPAMVGPMSLLVSLAVITAFISNEDPTFYDWIGRHFVALTVWMSSGLLMALGYPVVVGPDFFRIPGSPSLTVEIGIRCGGLDVALIYGLLIAYFASQTHLPTAFRGIIAIGGALGTLLVNGLRVVVLTTLFLSYPPQLVEAVHTNLGDFVFLGYAIVFILVLRKYRIG